MATDGVKIIDGDLAYDTYEHIMELYDSGASGEIIKNLKSASNLNGNLNCSKELEHYAS